MYIHIEHGYSMFKITQHLILFASALSLQNDLCNDCCSSFFAPPPVADSRKQVSRPPKMSDFLFLEPEGSPSFSSSLFGLVRQIFISSLRFSCPFNLLFLCLRSTLELGVRVGEEVVNFKFVYA